MTRLPAQYCPRTAPLYRALHCPQLKHLKRIRSSQHPGSGRVIEVVLSPPDVYYSLEETKRKELEKRYCLKPTVHAVPKLEPRTRKHFENGQSAWPMIFHHG